jgi:LuxR family quorum-sensing system transcriptional regulator CciR
VPLQDSFMEAQGLTPIFQQMRENAAGALGLIQDFVSTAGKATEMAELKELVGDASKALGFDYYAMVQHVRFGLPSKHVRLTNYPIEWLAYVREQTRLYDPVLRAAERASSGFKWEKLDRHVTLSRQEQEYMARAARYGLVNGYTVPNHVPGETFGSCHFVVRPDREFRDESIPAAQALGNFAFEAARRLLAERGESSEAWIQPAPLSERQRECLLFVAKGKSDSIIGQLLNIKPRTVNEHIEAAKRRYSVATRSQLLVRALFRSEICFSEVL